MENISRTFRLFLWVILRETGRGKLKILTRGGYSIFYSVVKYWFTLDVHGIGTAINCPHKKKKLKNLRFLILVGPELAKIPFGILLVKTASKNLIGLNHLKLCFFFTWLLEKKTQKFKNIWTFINIFMVNLNFLRFFSKIRWNGFLKKRLDFCQSWVGQGLQNILWRVGFVTLHYSKLKSYRNMLYKM